MREVHSARPWNSVLSGLFIAGILVGGCSNSTEPPDTGEPLVGLRLEALTETSLTGTVGIEVTPAPVVRVIDRDGRPVPGITVRFEARTGFITRRSVQTDGDGTATAAWTLGPKAGADTLTASAGGTTAVMFTAMAEPGPAARITRVSANNQAALVGATLSPLRVLVTDQFHNLVRGAPVTFAVISGGGTIDGGAVFTDSAGIATSGAWTLGPSPGPQQVRAEIERAAEVFTALACDDICQHAELVFIRSGEIFLTNLAGEARQLTISDSRDDEPAWSPDGRRIAFVRYDQAWPGDLYLMDSDGSDVMRRAPGFRSPAWSPDGRLLAVSRGDCTYECDIYLLSVDDDGTGPDHIAAMAAQPAWSPDGKKIAFVSLSGDDGYHALHVMNADGSAVTAITQRDEGGLYDPTWSPDGSRIAFTKCIAGSCNILVVNSDGAGVRQLTTVGIAFHPSWSPDGNWIAFTLRSGWGDPGSVALLYAAADSTVGEPISLITPGSSPAWRP